MCEDIEIWVSSCLVQGCFFFIVIFRWCVLDFVVELDILCCGYVGGIGKGLCGCRWSFESREWE